MNNVVCVALTGKYDDSMGAYDIAVLWDGEKVTYNGSMYNPCDFSSVTATLKEKREASIWLEQNTEYTANYNKYAQCDTYQNCIVTLKRSRKAPNNIPLKVVDFQDKHWSNKFNKWIDTKVVVLDETTQECYTVSYNCIDQLIQGIQKFPYWYIDENEYQRQLIRLAEVEADKQATLNANALTSNCNSLEYLALFCATYQYDGITNALLLKCFKNDCYTIEQIHDLISELLDIIMDNSKALILEDSN